MENDKPTYEQIEQELNEYKELLWQLSDEYKLNLGNAEKQLAEEKAKYTELESSKTESISIQSADYISSLGLPACILDNNGQMLKYNNKFKFLVELIGFEIENITNLNSIFDRDILEGLTEKYKIYLSTEDGLMQSLICIENQFKGLTNVIFRIYRNEEENQHLALFIELSQSEIKGLLQNHAIEKNKENEKAIPSLEETVSEDFIVLKTEIAIFTEKYELLEEILKMTEFSPNNKETSGPTANSIKKTFSLDNSRNRILEKLQTIFKTFVAQINQKYPELTNNEERHCMLIKAGLTYKEIAAIMGVSINGVKIARNRLRKKFDLENETKTSDFIDKIL